MTHLKKYLIWYALVIVVVIALIAYNWTTVKGWFSSSAGTTGSRTQAATSSSRQACISLSDGNCSYLGLEVACIECSKRGIQIK